MGKGADEKRSHTLTIRILSNLPKTYIPSYIAPSSSARLCYQKLLKFQNNRMQSRSLCGKFLKRMQNFYYKPKKDKFAGKEGRCSWNCCFSLFIFHLPDQFQFHITQTIKLHEESYGPQKVRIIMTGRGRVTLQYPANLTHQRIVCRTQDFNAIFTQT